MDEQGRFKSDKHPELKPDKVIIDLTDPAAWNGLISVARGYRGVDNEFARDLEHRVQTLMDAACAVGDHRIEITSMRCIGCGIAKSELENEVAQRSR